MSPRVTRSSAREAASLAASSSTSATPAASGGAATPAALAPAPPSTTRKRKTQVSSSPAQDPPETAPIPRRPKRQRLQPTAAATPTAALPKAASSASKSRSKGKAPMSSPGAPGSALTPGNMPSASSSRRSSRNKTAQSMASQSELTQSAKDQNSAPLPVSTRRSKRHVNNQDDQDVVMTGTDEHAKGSGPPPPPPPPEHAGEDSEDNDLDEDAHRYDVDEEDDDDDPFGGFAGRPGFAHSLQALTSMMSGMTGRLRDILNQLQQKGDPSVQLIALQELSEILLVSNEDNLSGHFSPDSFVKELVALMQMNEITGEENPEIMLLACRCLANLMEALPASTANVVYGGAVPVLCQKLLEISFIDLAEQALSTLEKISVEFPTSIVREGGLAACLSYLEFFATSTQRVAVTTAANCCRNIPEDSFPTIQEVMPTLLNVLGSNDQRVVEQASLCVSRIVESFKYHPQKLEELVSVDLLKAVLRLLLPGSTNLIGPNIHTQFLRVLSFAARASPRLSAELFKMNVVETLYQILTGVSPPAGTDDVASKLDSVLIMQALIHRPREQILETLNVICELLPNVSRAADAAFGDFIDMPVSVEPITPLSESRKKTPNEKRIELLGDCREEVRRFALILFPTLTDAYSSTVNLNVRQKVLSAQLKMLSNLDEDILLEALKPVPYASFLASILSQQDHPTLLMYALQATELLMSRVDNVYRYQLYREGVIAEITKLATHEPEATKEHVKDAKTGQDADPEVGPSGGVSAESGENHEGSDGDVEVNEDDEDGEDANSHHDSAEDDDDEDDDDQHQDEHDAHPDDISASPASSEGSTMSIDGPPGRQFASDISSMKSRIAEAAQKFLDRHETEKQGKSLKKKATKILANLTNLAAEIEAFYLLRTPGCLPQGSGNELFSRLASYFDSDVLESVTSAELLASGVVRVLEKVFSNSDESLAVAAQSAFLQVFMGYTVKSKPKTATADSPATPLSVMIHKLQDLLSRSEHFEVITVHNNSFDGNRSSAASMLAKQIRLKLVADENSEIPRHYRNIMVSIHAITTFKSLDDYLRPRISLSERPRASKRSEIMSRAMAAIASSSGLPLSAAARLAERLPHSSALTAAPPPPVPVPSSSRSTRKSKSKTQAVQDNPATPDPGATKEKAVLRRSSRRHAAAENPPPRPPPEEADDLARALECADEKQLTDDDSMGEGSALNVVRDLDEGMEDAPTPDPSAVNLEVATGGRITARKEDGTRVPTPSQGRPPTALPSRSSAFATGTPTPASSSRPMSYAAAVQAVPQDWHIEFSIDGKVIPNETTIYRAVHSSAIAPEDHSGRSVWSAVHSIKFRRVPGPPPPESIGFSTSTEASADPEDGNSRGSLSKHPTTASILRLLKKLHDLNANIEDVIAENKETLKLNVEPLSQFVNTKLTAKLNRQLEEPLIVASNCLPSWSEDLARFYPFLFPFETRHLFLQSTSFGYARSMSRWQNAQSQEETRRERRDERPFLGRLQRQKVRISRSKILESAVKVMELYGASQSILEVEYFEEVGTGLGPTLEFYSTVSKEFSKKKLKLWRDNDPNGDEDYVSGQTGLFPRPLSEEQAASDEGEKILQLFKVLGKFVARSMIDSRIIDLNFNPIFFRVGEESSGVRLSLGAVRAVDPVIANSLALIKRFAQAKKAIDEDHKRTAAQKVADTEKIVIDKSMIDDLFLDFTLPGFPDFELIPGGRNVKVTIENVEFYLEKVIDMTLSSGVRRQADAFRAGFSQVFPYSALSAFTPDELCTLFGHVEEDWTLETLLDSIKADHGFNMDSKSVRNLLHTMSELSLTERREFLQFTTGSPRLPIGGFKTLTPMFTVVCKPSEAPYTSDDYLPSVMTCVNYLKLPDYTDVSILKRQLFKAFKEGQGAFHLS